VCLRKLKKHRVLCKHISKEACTYDRDEVESLTVMYDLDSTVCIAHRHVLLLRDPVAILASWDNFGDIHGNSFLCSTSWHCPHAQHVRVPSTSILLL
jgi:hypothetical protein